MRRGERVAPQRLTFAEAAASWQHSLAGLSPNTRAAYGSALRVHLLPAFGPMRLQAIGEDDIAEFVAGMDEQGYAGFTVKAAVLPLGRVFEWAIRRGIVARNPLRSLERSERPAIRRRELRVLGRDEIAALLASAADERRALLACAVFTGLRLGELLGLTWRDSTSPPGRCACAASSTATAARASSRRRPRPCAT